MRLVTYQLLNSQQLHTGIQISKDQVLNIAAEVSLLGAPQKVGTMLDIIAGGGATMALLREIEASPRTAPIMLNKALLKADVILISDTSMLSMENPSIDIGVRGLSYIEIEVTGPNRDLHSGIRSAALREPRVRPSASIPNTDATPWPP